MSEPRHESTAEQPVAAPTVSTAPSPSLAHRWWSAIPSHVGPARLSTVVLALLFLAIGALYLQVRPDPVAPATAGGGVVQTTTPARTPKAPTTAAPTPTDTLPTTATPTPTSEPLPTTEPTATTTEPVPQPTTDSGFPTSTPPPTPDTASTTASPPS
jgi:cytoskeletal protein RodZ